MDYRRTSLALNRQHQHQATSNSSIYASFAGGGPPRNIHGNIFETSTMWWDEERIEATVNRQFVLSKLRPDEQARLDEQLGFGDGLTDDTYMEWIEQKAKRIFLILVDLGVPDQIFGVVDDSWDDDDLPVPMDQVERLQLTYDKDEKLERKFFHRQFYYLLRDIKKGEHVYYDDVEVVPLELTEKRPIGAVAGLTHTNIDKVHLPARPDDLLLRRRIPLGVTPGRMPEVEFLSGIEAMKVITHTHLTSLYASYIYQSCGYLLLTPVYDSTLKSFLAVTPPSIKIMPKQDRRILLLNWIHCLSSAIAHLHSQGLAHKNIKPSTVMLDAENHIFLSDAGVFPLSSLDGEKQGFDIEAYNYSAPEQGRRPPAPPAVSLPVTRPVTAKRATGPGPDWDALSFHTSSSDSPPNSHGSSSKRPHDPQTADLFSLGAIFLEIITFLLKRASRNFASHRSAKNKTPGRGGGLPDSSFQKNAGQVESWISTLAKDSSKKEDSLFRGISRLLPLIGRMLSPDPEMRPHASEVKERVHKILTETLPGGEEKLHCLDVPVAQEEEWNFGFENLRLASQRAAAEACASVNQGPGCVTANGGTLGLHGGVIYGVERLSAGGGMVRVNSGGIVSSPTTLSRSASGIGQAVTMSPTSHSRSGSGVAYPLSPSSPSFGTFSSSLSNPGLSRAGSGLFGGRKESTVDSIATKTSHSSSEGRSRSTGTNSTYRGTGGGRVKRKAKAWQAPVYSEVSFA